MRKNNRAARAARTLVEFFDVVCPTTDDVKVYFSTLTPNSKFFILYICFYALLLRYF